MIRVPKTDLRWPAELLFLVVAALLFLSACGGSNSEGWESYWLEHRFQEIDGRLFRGESPYFLRAVEAPHLLDPATTYEQKVAFLNELCSAGGNSVAVGVPADQLNSGTVDPHWLGVLRGVTQETQYRQMGVLLRVPADRAGPTEIQRWVADLARKQADQWDTIYWFDGPGATAAARQLRSAAPRLIVAAPEDGHLRVVQDEPRGTPMQLHLLVGKMGAERPWMAGFVLPAGPEGLQQLEEAYSDIRQPFFPADQSLLSADERGQGFLSLFDGKSFEGWVVTGEPTGWRIQEQAMNWVERGGSYIRSARRYRDFILRLEWRVFEREANSGIFVRAPVAGRASRIGMEFQVFGDFGIIAHPTGTGSVYDVFAPLVNASRPLGEWNEVEIVCQGSRFRATLNGEIIHDLDLDAHPVLRHRLKEGFLAFQDHGHRVSFRNIRIKELLSEARVEG